MIFVDWLNILILILYAAIPFDRLTPSLFRFAKEISSKMDTEPEHIYVSKAPLASGFSKIAQFGKGYIPFFIMQNLIIYPTIILYSMPLLIICIHLGIERIVIKQSSPRFFFLVWGLYTAIYTPFGFIFPILVLLSTLLFDHYLTGILTSILVVFIGSLIFQGDMLISGLSAGIFLILFLCNLPNVFNYIEGKKWRLIDAYRNR